MLPLSATHKSIETKIVFERKKIKKQSKNSTVIHIQSIQMRSEKNWVIPLEKKEQVLNKNRKIRGI